MTQLPRSGQGARRQAQMGSRAARKPSPRARRAMGWDQRRVEVLEERQLLTGMTDMMTIEDQRALNLVPDGLFFTPTATNPRSSVAHGFYSVKTGNWEDPTVWNQGAVPNDGSNVLISDGTTVTVTADDAVVKKADGTVVARNSVTMLRVDGTLSFDTSAPPAAASATVYRRLLVDTIVVSPMNYLDPPAKAGGASTWHFTSDESTHGGSFLMGTDVLNADGTVKSTTPIPRGVVAEVVFADNGPTRDLDFTKPDHGPADPYQLGRGLIAMSRVRIDGSPTTSDATVAPDPKTGVTRLGPETNGGKPVTVIPMTSIPADWQPGDRMVITGDTADNAANVNQDEQFAIKSIDRAAGKITIDDPFPNSNPRLNPFTGLVFNHVAPAGASIYVADVSRNAIFRSENPFQVADRGHVIFMHDADVHVSAAGFYGLGRTDKRTLIDDPVLVQDYDSSGNPIKGQYTDDVLDTKNPALKSNGYRVMVPVTDQYGQPVLNPDGTPKLQIARSGLNPRARYAVHFHHAMPDDMSDDFTATTNFVKGSAVVDSPGWGIVNHSSTVDVQGNVVFNATGAAFVTEAGNELGSFIGNIAIHSQGSGESIESRIRVQDFGHQGDGFWLQGGNVDVENNVSAGQRHSGFVFFPVGLSPTLQMMPGDKPAASTTTIALSDLPASYAALYKAGTKSIPVGDVPLKTFKNNVALGDGDALETWFSLLNVNDANPADARKTVVNGFTAFADGNAPVINPYTNKLAYQNTTVIGNVQHPGGTAFGHNHVTRNLTFDHVDVEGFEVGVDAPVNGVNTIIAGVFENVKNINISTANSRDRVVDVRDGLDVPVVFKPFDAKVVALDKQFDVYLQSNFNPFQRDITTLFNPDVIRLGTVKINGKQAYYLEQDGNFVPFPAGKSAAYIPPELTYKDPADPKSGPMANNDIFAKYGLAVGGIVAPSDAHTVPRVHGLVSDNAATYPFDLTRESRQYSQFPRPALTTDLQDYTKVPLYTLTYTYKDATGLHKVSEATGTQLHQGWNLLTRAINGATRTVLVYGDDVAPDFVPAKNSVWTINKADWDNNSVWMLEGDIVDDSTGSEFFRKNFVLGDLNFFHDLRTNTDAAGVVHTYVTFSMTITDRAGNSRVWSHDMEITATAPLLKDVGRKTLPDIKPSETLIALIDADPRIPKK